MTVASIPYHISNFFVQIINIIKKYPPINKTLKERQYGKEWFNKLTCLCKATQTYQQHQHSDGHSH